MEVDKILLCRLCLEICKPGSESTKTNTKEMLNFLLLDLDLAVTHGPVVCNSCADALIECFNFKTGYLHRRALTSIKHEDIEFKEPKMQLVEYAIDAPEVFSSYGECCCCMELIKQDTSVFLMNEEENMLTMLEKYFPELVLHGTTNCVCITCYESLQNQLAFISNCLTVEEKIKEYCKVEGTNTNGQVDLCNVLHFISKNQLQNNFDDSSITVKLEEGCEEVENEDEAKVKNEDLIETEETGIHCIEDNGTDVKVEQDDNRFDTLQTVQENSLELSLLTDKSTTGSTVFKSETHMHQIKRKGDLSNLVLTRKHPLEVTAYKCDICAFETKHRTSLRRHMRIHNPTQKNTSDVETYKCEICTFETKHKLSIQRHMLTHKDPSEVKVYKCEICSYRGKLKHELSSHMLIHKHPSEVTTYKCEKCAFETKHKSSLQRHVLTHKSTQKRTPEEVLFHCEICTYQSKYKHNLARHMFAHNSPSDGTTTSDGTTYRCEICSYQSRRKYNFSRHMLNHKHPSEATTYKCEICPYQTKYKYRLPQHMLTHTDQSELKIYKCEVCTYQTRHKRYLPEHMIIHRDLSERIMYKCDLCTYQSKRKSCLSKHILTHKDPSDVVIYKCKICTYQSRHRGNLSHHMLIHKDPSQVTMHKCKTCTYQSRRKDCLKKHVLTHKKPSEVTMYKCEMCIFKTKHKASLKLHMLTHKITPSSTAVNQYWEDSGYNADIIMTHIAGKM